MKTSRMALLSFLLFLPASVDAAEERILNYDSQVTVEADGSLTVREDIRVNSAQHKIRRGIYRDFPVIYARGWFTRKTVPFRVKQVLRDGNHEAWHTTDEGDMKRVYIGRENVVLNSGVHVFTLVYETDDQLGFFEEHDELYWNVTGNEWEFPIDNVSCTVTLPGDVPAKGLTHEAYTGPRGAKGRDYTSEVRPDGKVRFQTTRRLGVKEGLTVVVTWPKGYVTEPGAREKFMGFLVDNSLLTVSGIGLVVVFVYFLIAWNHVGRDPRKGLIIPLFDPPDGMSPASVRYVRRMGFDKTCFTAAVINTAVKGYLTIKEDDGEFSLVRKDDAAEEKLSPDERVIAKKLIKRSRRLKLDHRLHSRFQEALKEMKKTLREGYHGRLFHGNLKYFIPGAVMSGLSLVLAAGAGLVTGRTETAMVALFLCVWLSLWSVGCVALGTAVVNAWKGAGRGTGWSKAGGAGGALFLTLFSVPFFVGEIVALGVLVYFTSLLMIPLVLGLVAVNAAFRHLLKAPTEAGRKVMDHIDGLRMYLSTAEEDFLHAAHPPERTPEVFERFLPYAVALGVENQWAEKFSDVLAVATVEGQEGYSPVWYHGTSWRGVGGAGGLVSSLGGSFTSAMSAASTAPGSSSGGGGGGSSGGGGGGGGGGGW